jgi:CBS domain-containing protein
MDNPKFIQPQLITMKKVRDYMNPDIIFFKPEDSIFDVAKVFSERRISGAPVVEGDEVVGVISISDIVKFMSLGLPEKQESPLGESHILYLMFLNTLKDELKFREDLKKISSTQIKDIMSKEIISVSPDTSLYEAASIMEKHDVNRLPVIENGKLVGIIARADLIKALIE